MTSDDLCMFAESRGHDVDFFPLRRLTACTVEIENHYGIAIGLHQTEQEIKARLAHELGHCEYAGVYERYSPFVLREQIEHRADKWAFVHLLPYGRIRECVRQGAKEAWEIAEMVDLPEWFVSKAIAYYKTSIISRRRT